MNHFYGFSYPDFCVIAGSRKSLLSSTFKAPSIAILRECLPVKEGELIRGSKVEEISMGVEQRFRAGLIKEITVEFTGIPERRKRVGNREILVIRITKEAGEHELYHYARIIGGICESLELIPA